MKVKAEAKFVKFTPRKIRLLVDMVRNKPANDAMVMLKMSPKAGAKVVADVLKNALSIAKDREMNLDLAYISETMCDDGPRLKRGISAGRGHFRPIHKQMCHITIVLSENEKNKSQITNPKTDSKKKVKTLKKPV